MAHAQGRPEAAELLACHGAVRRLVDVELVGEAARAFSQYELMSRSVQAATSLTLNEAQIAHLSGRIGELGALQRLEIKM